MLLLAQELKDVLGPAVVKTAGFPFYARSCNNWGNRRERNQA
jgi:hypothetical protein